MIIRLRGCRVCVSMAPSRERGAAWPLSTPPSPPLFFAPRLDNEADPYAFCVYIHIHTNVLNAPPRERAIKRHDACASTRGTVWRAFELPPPYFSNGKHGFETRSRRLAAPVLLSFYSSSFAMQPDVLRKIGLTNHDIPVEYREVLIGNANIQQIFLTNISLASLDLLCLDFRIIFEI